MHAPHNLAGARLRHDLLAQLLPHDGLKVRRALKSPLPVRHARAIGAQPGRVGRHEHLAVLQAGQLARVVGLEHALHVEQGHQHVARLIVYQQQVPGAGASRAAQQQTHMQTHMAAHPFHQAPHPLHQAPALVSCSESASVASS